MSRIPISKKKLKKLGILNAAFILFFAVITFFSCFVFFDLLNIVMPGGGRQAIYKDGQEAIYKSDVDGKEEALQNALKTNIKLAEEGIVLVKNNNNALPIKTPVSDSGITTKPKVSIFGKNSVNIAYSGSGSGGGDTSSAIGLYEALESSGFDCNPVLKNFYISDSKSGSKRAKNSSDLDNGDSISIATGETPQDLYNAEVTSSYNDYNDAAIIVLTRVGGEGFDLPRRMGDTKGARDSEDTYLQLDKNETDLINAVSAQGFKRVIVVINSSSTMELSFLEDPNYYAYNKNIDSCLLIGYPGNNGLIALGNILNGIVNPSGRTVDTYASNLKQAPSFYNIGDNSIKNGDRYNVDGDQKMYYFVDYEEGIYVGYKYYETRAITDGEEWYKDNVIYPLGYGLSYTKFKWEVEDSTSIKDKIINGLTAYDIKIKVTNIGSVPGKDVIQLYGHAPYYNGEIEKSEVSLMDFNKTKLLQPGESEVLTLTFNPYYLASYDYKDLNKNGFRGYELDPASDDNGYKLYVSKNAHDIFRKISFLVPKDGIKFENDPTTGTKVQNLYTDNENKYFDSDMQLSKTLSRSNWDETWPTTPTDRDRSVSIEFIKALQDISTNNPNDYTIEDMPWTDESNGLVLRDLLEFNVDGSANINYEDKRWEKLLDQANADEMIQLLNYAAFQTKEMKSVGKPRTNDTDGPVGFVNFMDKTTFYGTCSYVSEVVISSTWNKMLAKEFGISIGNEGLAGNEAGDGAPYSGWYAPACNIHRSPFGGRNFEYFSEDGILSGAIISEVIKGAQSKGVYCYVKHFALNEQETHRSIGGDLSWATEQSIREIYLKPFELSVKDGGTRAMMSSFNRIGTRWTGGDYRLLTSILREEWGFKGMVISDFNTVPDYMDSRLMAYAGGDLNLATTPVAWCDTSDISDMVVLRQSTKNILYTVGNSNALNGDVVGYTLPVWTIVLIIVDSLLFGLFLIWCFVYIKSK